MTNRPLSPHLQIYKPAAHLGAVDPASHHRRRACRSGTLLLVYWLIAAASGPGGLRHGRRPHRLLVRPPAAPGLDLRASSFTSANGIRHLFWDAGIGFELKTVYASGWTVVAAATVLTLVSWIAGFAALGDCDAARLAMTDHRTALARVRGLGSAKEGVHHWWVQRVTALLLIPLVVWFVAAFSPISAPTTPA